MQGTHDEQVHCWQHLHRKQLSDHDKLRLLAARRPRARVHLLICLLKHRCQVEQDGGAPPGLESCHAGRCTELVLLCSVRTSWICWAVPSDLGLCSVGVAVPLRTGGPRISSSNPEGMSGWTISATSTTVHLRRVSVAAAQGCYAPQRKRAKADVHWSTGLTRHP